ncbi:hypothetical protein [Melittangium boletus]|uniref:Uncharacterized protein n=1 Tax=Melittangium boletus DSM 14713 TaxID=1294270 RepID=A0A250IP03_9BACT|nr:hypothetical protein [Melittangium boletus]ATB32970.1 hypothetical protein MEBOL_006459 [Melittangium boletus DSM 14713]
MSVMVVSLLGIVAFGGAFLLLGGEWWSSSRGTLKDDKPKHPPKK